jgi:hypothetical protein
MTEPPVRPPNATKNPFLESALRAHKRPLDNVDGAENFIFGNVQQPVKRSRVGEILHDLSLSELNVVILCRCLVILVQGEPGKPPPGYKCRRCESTEVSACTDPSFGTLIGAIVAFH